MLHLDDWEHCEDLYNDPLENKILFGGLQKVKILNTKFSIQYFFKRKEKTSNFIYRSIS